MRQEIATISAHYDILVDTIQQLESRKMKLSESLKLIDSVSHSLSTAPGTNGESIRVKFQSVIDKNTGLETLKKVNCVLNDEPGDDIFDTYTIEEALCLQFAPLTSCEVERAFSYYKMLLSDRRRRFKIENLNMHLTVSLNRALGKIFFILHLQFLSCNKNYLYQMNIVYFLNILFNFYFKFEIIIINLLNIIFRFRFILFYLYPFYNFNYFLTFLGSSISGESKVTPLAASSSSSSTASASDNSDLVDDDDVEIQFPHIDLFSDIDRSEETDN